MARGAARHNLFYPPACLPASPNPPHPAPRRGMIEVPVNVEEGFIASDWEILGGEYFARKEWIKEDAANGLIEAGTLKLYHRPGQ
ncbi:MAG: hypothetical protein AB1457_13800 [Chloroflexota bacterium]